MYLADVALAGSIANKGAKSVRFYSVRGKEGGSRESELLASMDGVVGKWCGMCGMCGMLNHRLGEIMGGCVGAWSKDGRIDRNVLQGWSVVFAEREE